MRPSYCEDRVSQSQSTIFTSCQLIVEQQGWFPTQLTAEQAAGLHRESVVVAQQQAADAEIGLSGVSQAGRQVGHTVVHMHFVALVKMRAELFVVISGSV